MHEYSIVQALLDQCERHAREHNAEKIMKVTVKIGVLSGVEPHLLEQAFETFKEGTLCDGCSFVMEIQDVVVRCRICNSLNVPEKLHMLCPTCGSNEVEVTEGEEMLLMQLEMI